jgi:hypothetical protein
MKLRNHPDRHQWPPDWAGSYRGAEKMPVGEVGTLLEVNERPKKGENPPYLSLKIKHETGTATGVLQWKKPDYLPTLAQKLKAYIGKSIKEVGGMEL